MGGEGGWIIIDKTIGASQEGQNMEETEITLNNITLTHLDNKLSSKWPFVFCHLGHETII